MHPRPCINGEWYSIDRINNDGDYSPENCRWSSKKEQQNNKRNNVIIEYNQEKLTLVQWSEKLGIKYSTLQGRIKQGLSIEEAFNKKLHSKGNKNVQ